MLPTPDELLTKLVWELRQHVGRYRLILEGPGADRAKLAHTIVTLLGRSIISPSPSNYISETEKNLAQLFTSTQQSSAILFFDEADALFGKRSEVRDAYDWYASLEVSYSGVVILGVADRNSLWPEILNGARVVSIRDHWPPL